MFLKTLGYFLVQKAKEVGMWVGIVIGGISVTIFPMGYAASTWNNDAICIFSGIWHHIVLWWGTICIVLLVIAYIGFVVMLLLLLIRDGIIPWLQGNWYKAKIRAHKGE